MKNYYDYICPVCKKEFKHIQIGRKFCSKDCMYVNNSRIFRGRVFSPEWREKIRLSKIGNTAMVGKHLSQSHKNKLRDCRLGEKNPMWKGGITRFIQRIRQLKQYKTWKWSVLQRDYPGITSQEVKRNRIQVHHLYPVNEIISDMGIKTIEEVVSCGKFWEIDNGISIRKGEHFLLTQLERMKYPTDGFIKFLGFMISNLDNYKRWEPKKYKRRPSGQERRDTPKTEG